MNYCVIAAVVLMVALCVVTSPVPADSESGGQECKFWKQLSKNLSDASSKSGDMLQMVCNHTCNSMQCSGDFKQTSSLFGKAIELKFCFGVRLNHCAKPHSMSYYLDLPTHSVHHYGRVEHNDSFEVPGPTFLGSASTIVILIEMQPVNASYIMFGIEGNLKVMAEGQSVFAHKEKVFPPTLIDIPPCTEGPPKTLDPFPGPAMCVPPTLLPTGAPTSTAKPFTIHSSKYNQSCEIGLLDATQCSTNEMCVVVHPSSKSHSGVCKCDTESTLDHVTGLCQRKTTAAPVTGAPITGAPGHVTVAPSSTAAPSVTQAHGAKAEHKSTINKTGVIIAGVVGGLLLIVIAVSVVIFIGRRRRTAMYRNRHQLLTDDLDDGDSGNVVI